MYKNLINKIKSEEKGIINIGIFAHKNPDYDAVGSVFTLANYLKSELGERVKIYPILDNYDNLRLKINNVLDSYDETLDIKLDYGVVLDVNEEDLLYGRRLFNSVCLENRYIFDHHMGNRVVLNILDSNKLIRNDASSTCEVLASELLKESVINELNSYNLFLGIASDTVGFNIGVKSNTMNICSLLNISDNDKEIILKEVSGITKSQEKLFKRIEKTEEMEGLTIYKLLLNSDEGEKVKELYGIPFEKIITPVDLDTISFLLVECGDTVFYKLRKHENSELDIVELAKSCNGGGHSNRCAGRLVDMNYEKALEYVVLNYKSLNKNKVKQLKRKI